MQFDIATYVAYGIEGLFYVLLAVYTMHAIFLAYHWFSYGNNKRLSLLALCIYLIGGAALFLTLTISLQTI